MSKTFIAAMLALATVTSAATFTTAANARVAERTVTGAAIGAGAGAVVAGPPGLVVGGVVGAVVGGPRLSHRHCWRNSNGYRHCR